MIVAQDGSGDFRTIQEAIDQVPQDNRERVVIHVKPGAYYEKLHIDKKMVTLIGEPGQTVVTYDDCAVKRWPNGQKYGTFHSYSVLVSGDDFTAEGITFENSAGPGAVAGQALAVYIDADRVVFRCCRFLGPQDTIFTAPLPPAPGSGGRFNSPREDFERRMGRHYFENCFIAGDVDFIFGSSTAVFRECEIFLPQPPRWIYHRRLDSSGREIRLCVHQLPAYRRGAAESVYLGRPWRVRQRRCLSTPTWVNISKQRAGGQHREGKTVFYAEFNSFGPGAKLDQRVKWAKILTSEEAEEYTVENVLKGSDGWNPLSIK